MFATLSAQSVLVIGKVNNLIQKPRLAHRAPAFPLNLLLQPLLLLLALQVLAPLLRAAEPAPSASVFVLLS